MKNMIIWEWGIVNGNIVVYSGTTIFTNISGGVGGER